MSGNARLVELLDLLNIERVVVVDDDFLAGPGEFVEAVEAGDAPELGSLGAVPDGAELSAHAASNWDAISVDDKVRVRIATMKGRRDYPDPTGLRALIGEQEFKGLAMAEWQKLSERLLGANKRTLLLFDVDLGGETGKQNDTSGLQLAADALAVGSKQIIGLLTSKAEVGQEEPTAARWARSSHVQAAEFVVVNKRLLRDGTEQSITQAIEQIRATLQAAQLSRLRAKVRAALDDGISNADDELGGRSPSILEDVVFRSSHEGGEWEGDTWFRLYNTLGLDRARRTVAIDPEVRSAIADVRRLLQSRPQQPHPDSAALASEVEAAEAYEDADYINGAGLPIANGDFFRAKDDPVYVLVGQPCDLALRPDGRAYAPTTATLLPVKRVPKGRAATEEDRSAYRLPDGGPLGSGDWEVRFRPEYHVAFDLLDLCSLNTSGKTTTHPSSGTALDPLLPGVKVRMDEILKAQTALQKLLAQIDELQEAKRLEAQAANRIRRQLLAIRQPFSVQLGRKPAAFEFGAERIGRLAGSYADALLAAHSSARARTAHAHELTRIVRRD